VSHDLKNPLQAISLHAQMLARKLRATTTRAAWWGARRSADRMGSW